MSEPKRYQIRTVADFVALPPGKVAACLTDFEVWLGCVRHTKAVFGDGMRVVSPLDVFEWVDDGRHVIDLTLRDHEGNVIAREDVVFAPAEAAQ